MFKRENKEKELRERLIKVEEQRNSAMREARAYFELYHNEKRAYSFVCKEIDELNKELEEQKAISAEHISRYYDVVQKLKTVMEETNYGQDL